MRFLNTIETGSSGVDVIDSSGNWIGNTLNASKIPSLDASKISSGTFAVARIPNLDASKITAGTLAAARIPDLSSTYATVSHNHDSSYVKLDGSSIISNTLKISSGEMGGTYRSWMTQGVLVGGGGSDGAYFGMKVNGSNDAQTVIAWGDDSGDNLHFVNTMSGGAVDGVTYMTLFGNQNTIRMYKQLDVQETIYATGGNSTNWNTAYGWGDHATAGYVTTTTANATYAAIGHNHSGVYDNYQSFNLKTNGVQRTTVQSGGTVDLVAGTNVSLSYSAGGVVTINSSYTNTNNYVSSATFNTADGVLTLNRSGLSAVTVDLDGRYLTSFSETDPVFSASVASQIQPSDIDSWNSAYGWGNHASIGYLTSESDTLDTVCDRGATTNQSLTIGNQLTLTRSGGIATLNTTTSGNDPQFIRFDESVSNSGYVWIAVSDDFDVSATNDVFYIGDSSINTSTNWRFKLVGDGSAYLKVGTTDEQIATRTWVAAQGYLTSETDSQTLSWNGSTGVLTISSGNSVDLDGRYLQSFTESDPVFSASAASGITSTNINNWNTAYGWGNHATAGYAAASHNHNGVYAPVSHSHNQITYIDTRSVDFPPNSYNGLTVHLKSNATDSLADGGSYHGVIHIQQWSDLSGGQNHQLAFTDNGNMWLRMSETATTWGGWLKVWDTSDFTSTNVTNWNSAYSWGNHAGLYAAASHSHTFASITSKPTTLSGYGITDAATSAQGAKADSAFGWGNHALAGYLTSVTNISGNAGTATTLQTARTINGTSFNGSANITTSTWGTARTITIGSTGKSVNGGANVSWSLAEIGAAASGHTHSDFIKNDSNGSLAGDFDLAPTNPFSWRFGTESNALREVHTQQLFTYGYHESGLATEGIGQQPTGTVVVATEHGLIPCDSVCNHMVMGVITHGHDSPVVMGAEPVLVTGEVKFGDYLVTSNKVGHAVAVSREYVVAHNLLDCCFAKALESGSGDSYIIKAMINKL